MDQDNQIEKLDQAINAIINQIHYLTTEVSIPSYQVVKKNSYDPMKDKIRNNTDVIWQLSTSLSHLLSTKNQLVILGGNNDVDSMYNFLTTGKSRRE